jgi:hypothetical protein
MRRGIHLSVPVGCLSFSRWPALFCARKTANFLDSCPVAAGSNDYSVGRIARARPGASLPRCHLTHPIAERVRHTHDDRAGEDPRHVAASSSGAKHSLRASRNRHRAAVSCQNSNPLWLRFDVGPRVKGDEDVHQPIPIPMPRTRGGRKRGDARHGRSSSSARADRQEPSSTENTMRSPRGRRCKGTTGRPKKDEIANQYHSCEDAVRERAHPSLRPRDLGVLSPLQHVSRGMRSGRMNQDDRQTGSPQRSARWCENGVGSVEVCTSGVWQLHIGGLTLRLAPCAVSGLIDLLSRAVAEHSARGFDVACEPALPLNRQERGRA